MTTGRLFQELKALGAGEFAHINGSLEEHLLGTEALLRKWGCVESVCVAGLFHAAYGTAGYGKQLVPLVLREAVIDRIGQEAEELVYLYCACDREIFYPRIGTSDQLRMPNRFTGEERHLTSLELVNLCEITLANEVQLAAASAAFRARCGQALAGLFERMQGLVGGAGLAEALEVVGNASDISIQRIRLRQTAHVGR